MSKPDEDWWGWLRKASLTRATEALIVAAQSIRTNNIKAKIDKTQENSKCRICGKAEESIDDVFSECCKLSPKRV